MGQQASRDAGRSDGRSPARRLRAVVDRSGVPPRTPKHNAEAQQASPKPRIPADTRVDGGFVVGQGVYSAKPEYDVAAVREMIVARRMAPFYKPVDEEEGQDTSECPICFLNFGGPLNVSRCCLQPICTECFVQIQRVDPKHTIPPSSQPAMCPFCVTPEFGIVYDPPAGDARTVQKPSAKEAIEQAENAVGKGGAAANGRTSFAPDHPRVVLVDTVHPHWHRKLEAALAAQTRQANRRVIMRQVGNTLVPIGVSSSRTGETLAHAVSQNARLGHNGPGGSIILHHDARVADLGPDAGPMLPSSTSGTASNASPSNALQRTLPFSRFRSNERNGRRPQIGDTMARTFMQLTPHELEQVILQETLRVSREEARHNEAAQARAPAEPKRTPRLSLELARKRASPERGRSRAMSDTCQTAHAPESPCRSRTPHGAAATTETQRTSPDARLRVAEPPTPGPSTGAQVDARTEGAHTIDALPTTPVCSTPALASAAAPAARPDGIAGAPSALGASPASTHASLTAAPSASHGLGASPTSTNASAPSTLSDRAVPLESRAPPGSGGGMLPSAPESVPLPATGAASVPLSKPVMNDLEQLAGAAPAPPQTASTNPFRRRLDAGRPPP